MSWFIIISILVSITKANTLVPVGAGVNTLADWSRTRPYVNLIHQARLWGSPEVPYDSNCTFDPKTGWKLFENHAPAILLRFFEDFGVVFVTDDLDLGGKYFLSAKGNAQVSLTECAGYITNQTYDATTNTMTAVINIREGEQQIMLSFRNTTGPGLTDIVFLQPGYDLASKSNISKVFLAHLSRFSLLRFMGWTDTNSNFETNWDDTTPVDWPQYHARRRNPWATIPLLVNSINKPIGVWINLPHNATDDYILHVARIMFSDLNPNNNIYLEYSNEVWNWGFPQATANLRAANYSVLHDGDPYKLNYDNSSNVGYWAWRRTAYQIKHIADLFKTVFGDDNVGSWKRVRPILAGQISFLPVIRAGLEYLNTVFGPPSNYLHGISGAPYFNLGQYSQWTNLTTDQVLDAFNISIQAMSPEQGWGESSFVGLHAVFSGWYGLPMYGYEGGPDTYGDSSLEAKVNATHDPRMTDICVTYLKMWYGYGFQELNWFVAGAHSMGKYGSWDILEDMRQETLIDTTTMFNATSPVARLPRPAPKLKAIDQVRQSTIEMNFGISIPASKVNATCYAGHREPCPGPYLRFLGPNATFFYPLKITQSPVRINITVYTSENVGILEGAINNDQFIQVQTPKTADWGIFAPAPVMQFNINQRTVPSVATFCLKVIAAGFAIESFDVAIATN